MVRDAPAARLPDAPIPSIDHSGSAAATGAVGALRLTRSDLLIGALVALLTAATFLPALGNGFVNWDDGENFLSNPYYRGLGPAQIRWMFISTWTGHYIPITWLTLGLDYVLWGMNPAGYHASSIALHALNTVLVYALALRLLALAVAARETAIQWGAAAVALFFGVHPLRVESVAWITERRDLVMGCFALLAVLAYLRAVDAGAQCRLDSRWRWTAVGCFALALLSKSAAVSLPVVLVALDRYPLGRMGRAGGSPLQRIWRLGVVEKAPFWLAGGAIAVIMLAVGAKRGLITPLAALGIPERLAISGYGLTFYLWKMFAPWPLSPLYTLFRPVVWWSGTYLVPGAVVLLLTAAAVAAGRRWPAGITAWVCYVASLVPMLGLFHNGAQITADRYTYLACLPWALLAGSGVAWCLESRPKRWVGRGVRAAAVGSAILLIILFMALTVRQVDVWTDSVTLWRQAATVEPDSDIPIFYLGWALAEARRFDEARAHFERARARVPDRLPWLQAQFTLQGAIIEERAGRVKDAESQYRAALALDPAHPVARIRLAALLLEDGERAEAEREWMRALSQLPEWNRYQLAEIRAAVARVPAAESEARGRLALALAALLERHRALEEAGEQYRLAAALIHPGDPAQREACERARRLAAPHAAPGPWPAACAAP